MTKRKQQFAWMALVFLAFVMVGCRDYAVLRLRSEPSGARVYEVTKDRYVGITPVTNYIVGAIPDSAWARPEWDPGVTLALEKDGYERALVHPRLDLSSRKSRSLNLPNYWDLAVELKPLPPVTQSSEPPKPAQAERVVQEVQAKPVEPPPAPPVAASPPAPGTVSNPPVTPVPSPPLATTNAAAPRMQDKTRPAGIVNLSTEPPNCSVTVDGKLVGESPVTITLPDGVHVIEVEKQGYKTYHKVVRVIEDSELTLRVRLEPK